MSVEVIITRDLVAYHDGFTRSSYAKGTKQVFDADFVAKMEKEGFVERVKKRSTKPAPIKKETKVKREKQGNDTSGD
jgi:hypothetical protein